MQYQTYVKRAGRGRHGDMAELCPQHQLHINEQRGEQGEAMPSRRVRVRLPPRRILPQLRGEHRQSHTIGKECGARAAMDRGGAIAYVAEAEIVHVHHETPRQVYNRYRREAMAFKQIFPEERFGFGNFVRLVTSNSVSDLWHAARQGVFRANWRTILWFRLMQFWGTYRGFRQHGPPDNRLHKRFYYPAGLARAAASRQPEDGTGLVEYAAYQVEASSDEAD